MQLSQWWRDKDPIQTHVLPTEQNGHHPINKEIAERSDKNFQTTRADYVPLLFSAPLVTYFYSHIHRVTELFHIVYLSGIRATLKYSPSTDYFHRVSISMMVAIKRWWIDIELFYC